MFDILDRNVQLNGFQNRTTLVPKVVHQAKGVYSFSSFDRYGTGGCNDNPEKLNEGLRELGFRDEPIMRQFEGISLDEYFGSDPQVDLIKIDTDGGEPFVFRGMQSLLRSKRPLTILCEYAPKVYTWQSADPFQFLNDALSAGFEISEFTPEGIVPVKSLERLTTESWTELLLIRGAA